MSTYASALENYAISDNEELIAIEAFIYGAFESDTSSSADLKKNLRKLANAKARDDYEEVKEAKRDVDENISELNRAAVSEKDAKKKEKLKKAAKIGGIIAATLAVAATAAVAIKKLKSNKSK